MTHQPELRCLIAARGTAGHLLPSLAGRGGAPVRGRPGKRPPKYAVVGRPIPARSRPIDRDEARALFGLPPTGPVLGVFGALAGARSLNELAVESFGGAGPSVLHVSGERDYQWLRRR